MPYDLEDDALDACTALSMLPLDSELVGLLWSGASPSPVFATRDLRTGARPTHFQAALRGAADCAAGASEEHMHLSVTCPFVFAVLGWLFYVGLTLEMPLVLRQSGNTWLPSFSLVFLVIMHISWTRS